MVTRLDRSAGLISKEVKELLGTLPDETTDGRYMLLSKRAVSTTKKLREEAMEKVERFLDLAGGDERPDFLNVTTNAGVLTKELRDKISGQLRRKVSQMLAI
eukprot:g16648.t1